MLACSTAGAACFALALRSPGCGCFCLRLDFQVCEGSQGTWVLSAFSTRTLAVGFRQNECRPGASAWACCPWFVALLHVRGSWSSWVFRAVHRCCFLGCCFPLSPSSLSCLHSVGFQQFGGSGRGFLSRGSWLLQAHAHEAQVAISVFVCLATLLSQYRRCCCLS